MSYINRNIWDLQAFENMEDLNSFLNHFSFKSWSAKKNDIIEIDQLTQDECEALWVKINTSLYSFH